jgi:hypothetical protein
MAGDARDFNNIETRTVIECLFFSARQDAEGTSRSSVDENLRNPCKDMDRP